MWFLLLIIPIAISVGIVGVGAVQSQDLRDDISHAGWVFVTLGALMFLTTGSVFCIDLWNAASSSNPVEVYHLPTQPPGLEKP